MGSYDFISKVRVGEPSSLFSHFSVREPFEVHSEVPTGVMCFFFFFFYIFSLLSIVSLVYKVITELSEKDCGLLV